MTSVEGLPHVQGSGTQAKVLMDLVFDRELEWYQYWNHVLHLSKLSVERQAIISDMCDIESWPISKRI